MTDDRGTLDDVPVSLGYLGVTVRKLARSEAAVVEARDLRDVVLAGLHRSRAATYRRLANECGLTMSGVRQAVARGRQLAEPDSQ